MLKRKLRGAKKRSYFGTCLAMLAKLELRLAIIFNIGSTGSELPCLVFKSTEGLFLEESKIVFELLTLLPVC